MKPQELSGLLEYLAKSLVLHREEVSVQEHKRGGEIQLDLQVSPEDMGRVIGKQGRVANSIRAILRVVAARNGTRVSMDVVDQD